MLKYTWYHGNYPLWPSSEEATEEPMCMGREHALLQELSNANTRLIQLERTIKWWSECTATWREKWGRVRIQRNELRDECKVLKGRNEALIMEFQKLQVQNETFWKEIEKLRLEKRTAVVGPLIDENKENNIISYYNDGVDVVNASPNNTDVPSSNADVPRVNVSLKTENVQKAQLKPSPKKRERHINVGNSFSDRQFSIPELLDDMAFIENLLGEKQSSTQSITSSGSRNTTDHVANAIIVEKLTKLKEYVRSCESFVSSKESESAILKANIIELQTSKREILKNYEDLKEQMTSRKKQNDDEGDTKTGYSSAERKIRELHSEIERLQQENCNEWTKREQCETDMSELRRELRHAYQNIKELQDEVSKKTEEIKSSRTTGMKLLNEELETKSHELIEIKSASNKLRKQLQEKTDALAHEKKRTEHLDGEVKRLRLRIDDLKKKILAAEENVDHQGNQVRRLQRSLDEQTQLSESLQEQLNLTTARFKRQSMILTSKTEEGESLSDES